MVPTDIRDPHLVSPIPQSSQAKFSRSHMGTDLARICSGSWGLADPPHWDLHGKPRIETCKTEVNLLHPVL